jgi:predicted membrane-bound spermidine synthase
LTERNSQPQSFTLPTALLIAVAAGAAGLVVELVWMRLLSLAFGSASLAAGSVVAALMLGMALGSVAGARLARTSPVIHRWLGGSLLVLASGALSSSPVLRLLADWDLTGALLGGLYMIVCSMPMGATIPLLVAMTQPQEPRTAGRLYAVNTFGAAFGVLAVGFLLLPSLGNFKTAAIGGALLAVLGALALFRRGAPTQEASAPAQPLKPIERRILAAYFVSAFAAMVSELAWIRALTLSIGSSTYAFTLVLGVYIAGLGIGAALSSRLLHRIVSPQRTFGAIQLAIASTCLLALPLLGWMPEFFGAVLYDRISSLASFTAIVLAVAAVTLLPPAILVGTCFPITLRWLSEHSTPVRASGLTLAVSTGGSMVAALLGSFVLIPSLRIEPTLSVALMLHASVGAVAMSSALERRKLIPVMAALALLIVVLIRPPWDVRIVHSGPYIYGSRVLQSDPTGRRKERPLFVEDDHVASIAVMESVDGTRMLRIDGKTDASTTREDMVTQILSAHIPLMLHGNAQKVMIVGLGSGVTVGSALMHDPQSIDIIEISPAVVHASKFFDAHNGEPFKDRRVKLHQEDARKFARRMTDRYDVIVSEPSNLWIAGMAGLFTQEFYRMCEARLADDGIMCQWFHAYKMPQESFRDALATFHSVFPHVMLWELWVAGDYIVIGSKKPIVVDSEKIYRAISKPAIARDLDRIGTNTVGGVLSDFVATTEDLKPKLEGARLQTDDGMHIEFSAPLGFYGRETIAALRALPDVNADHLAPYVQGRKVAWAQSRMLVREGFKIRAVSKSPIEPMPYFIKALRLYPEDRQARWFLEFQAGQCIVFAEQRTETAPARALLDAIPPESLWYVDARLRVISLLLRDAAPPGALAEEYRKILAVSPGHEIAAAEVTNFLLSEKSLKEADEVTSKAVDRNPQSSRLRVLRGRVLAALGKHSEAKVEWQEALKLDPSGPWGKEAQRHLDK